MTMPRAAEHRAGPFVVWRTEVVMPAVGRIGPTVTTAGRPWPVRRWCK